MRIFWAAISVLLIVIIFSLERDAQDSRPLDSNNQGTTVTKTTDHQFFTDQIVTISHVVDGDTLWVRDEKGEEYKIRLIGINAPEINHPTKGKECYGEKSRTALEEFLPEGTLVKIQTDRTQDLFDIHDRLLAYVTFEMQSEIQDIGEYMIRNGFAREYTYRKAYENQAMYRDAESQARDAFLGMWSCPA